MRRHVHKLPKCNAGQAMYLCTSTHAHLRCRVYTEVNQGGLASMGPRGTLVSCSWWDVKPLLFCWRTTLIHLCTQKSLALQSECQLIASSAQITNLQQQGLSWQKWVQQKSSRLLERYADRPVDQLYSFVQIASTPFRIAYSRLGCRIADGARCAFA